MVLYSSCITTTHTQNTHWHHVLDDDGNGTATWRLTVQTPPACNYSPSNRFVYDIPLWTITTYKNYQKPHKIKRINIYIYMYACMYVYQNRFRLLKPDVTHVPETVQPPYVAPLAIKKAKVKCVKVHLQYISPVAQQFIALLTATNQRDANTRWESD